MSTEYIIHTKEKDNTTQFLIFEHSNKFDLILSGKDVFLDGVSDLSENDLLQATLKMLQVCSYFMDTDELKEKVNLFIKRGKL